MKTMLMKEIKENTIPCSWTERINAINYPYYPKHVYIQCNPYQKFQVHFLQK